MKLIVLIIVIIFLIVILISEIYAFSSFIPKQLGMSNNENIEKFKKQATLIKGVLINYIVFSYATIIFDKINEKMTTITRFIYLPIIQVKNENNEEELISCSNIYQFGNLGESRLNYHNLGQNIELYIDKNNLDSLKIDLNTGYFVDKVYTKIDYGSCEEVKNNAFTNKIPSKMDKSMNGNIYEAKLYLAKDTVDKGNYFNSIQIAPGFISKIDNEDVIKKKASNFKLILKILSFVVYLITLGILLIFVKLIIKM